MNRITVFFLVFFLFSKLLYTQSTPVGEWKFDDINNLTKATVGNDLVLSGTHTSIIGPDSTNRAIRIDKGSYYHCYHGISPNGGGSLVNKYTLVFDFRINLNNLWHCFYQTNILNNDDGEIFISPENSIGVSSTGYSNFKIKTGDWYRLVISSNIDSSFDYYLDGNLLFNGSKQTIDNRFALNPEEVLLFADDNGEDNQIDIAYISIYDKALAAEEIKNLGGFNHDISLFTNSYMIPYLQSETDSSIYISWNTKSEFTGTMIEYGLTESLGSFQSGDTMIIASNPLWHTVKLENLKSSTKYYYRIISDTLKSEIYSFNTFPKISDNKEHIRFLLVGDTQTDVYMSDSICRAMKSKLLELYGSNYLDSINLFFHVGDIASNSNDAPEFVTEYLYPFRHLTPNIPFMISIGNHESESEFYYDYVRYDDFSGPEEEKYYSFNIGLIKFIGLNSVIAGDTQLNWLSEQIQNSDKDSSVQFIFTFQHYPARSEIWPDGNSNWVQQQVYPILEKSNKVVFNAHGHTHAYERGALINNNTYLMTIGGGGGALDRWNMYNNQTNYPEIQKSLDIYCYSIIDINIKDSSVNINTYSLGNLDKPQNNINCDNIHYNSKTPKPAQSVGLSPINISNKPIILISDNSNMSDSVYCSEYKIINSESGNIILDSMICLEDYYLDSGSPLYEPININQNIDLNKLEISGDILSDNIKYYWQCRKRNRDLKWSEWSSRLEFTVSNTSDISYKNSNLFDTNIFSISPNPCFDILKINFNSNNYQIINIQIINQIGDILSEFTETGSESNFKRLDLSEFPSGIYFIKINYYFENKIGQAVGVVVKM